MLFGNNIKISSPFGLLGTSHIKRNNHEYNTNYNYFTCCSFGTNEFSQLADSALPMIKIDFESDDDITVYQLNLKRGEDYNIDPDTITQDTYFKLLGKVGPNLAGGTSPEKLIDSINQYSDISPYYNIKDPLWPNIQSVKDYYNLPLEIRNECTNVFGFHPVYLSAETPHAPKWVMRSIFKSWFENISNRPSTIVSKVMPTKQLYNIPLLDLYDATKFKQHLIDIGEYFNLEFNLENFSNNLHQEFVNKVPYRDSKNKCQQIVNAVETQTEHLINLNVVEEGYVNFLLEKKYNIKMPFEREQFFSNTTEITAYINHEISNHKDG